LVFVFELLAYANVYANQLDFVGVRDRSLMSRKRGNL
jgi:hypothetical protein